MPTLRPHLIARAPRVAPPFALAALSLALLAGCGSKVIDLRDPQPADPTPKPATPALAVERLAWSWNRRDPAPCEDLYSADFRFEFIPDSVGAPPGGSWFRETELASIENLFVRGIGVRPPAAHITFVTDGPLVDRPSPEAGHDPRWHRVIDTRISLGVRTGAGDFAAMGLARFALVRGDSARIPQVLRDRGYEPDSTRWWIERWKDLELALPRGVQGAGATPVRFTTIAEIKLLYLVFPPD